MSVLCEKRWIIRAEPLLARGRSQTETLIESVSSVNALQVNAVTFDPSIVLVFKVNV